MADKQHKVGDIITINNHQCKLIYGPYNIALNYYWEVEDDEGKVYPVNTKTIKAQNKVDDDYIPLTEEEDYGNDTRLYNEESNSDDWN